MRQHHCRRRRYTATLPVFSWSGALPWRLGAPCCRVCGFSNVCLCVFARFVSTLALCSCVFVCVCVGCSYYNYCLCSGRQYSFVPALTLLIGYRQTFSSYTGYRMRRAIEYAKHRGRDRLGAYEHIVYASTVRFVSLSLSRHMSLGLCRER